MDVHYRDFDSVEHELAEAQAGRFRIEPLLFHLAGIPSYLVVAELAINQVLRGQLPRPDFPAALRVAAPPVWWGNAELLFGYARTTTRRIGDWRNVWACSPNARPRRRTPCLLLEASG